VLKEDIQKLLKKEISEHLTKLTQEAAKIRVDQFKTGMKRTVTVAGLFGLGLLFLLLGLAKYIPNIIKISEGAAFLIIGLVLIIAGLVYRAGGRE
jgi:hypothetical protein